MTTLNTIVISGNADLTAPMTDRSGQPIVYDFGTHKFPLTPALMATIWVSGEATPTKENFVETYSNLVANGTLNNLDDIHLIGPKGLYTPAVKDKKTGKVKEFYKPHVEITGWDRCESGKVYGVRLRFVLSSIAPDLFPLDGAKSRNLSYALPASKSLEVGVNLTQEGYDCFVRFEQEAKVAGMIKTKEGDWDKYTKYCQDANGNPCTPRDSKGKGFVLPSLGLNKHSVLIVNVAKKAHPNGGYYYGSQEITCVNGNRRPGVSPVNGLFYINHPSYAPVKASAWGAEATA